MRYMLILVVCLSGCGITNAVFGTGNNKVPQPELTDQVTAQVQWFSTAGVAIAIFSMVLYPNKWSMALLVAAVGTVAFSMAVDRYAWLVGLIGLIIGIGAGVYGFIQIRKKHKDNVVSVARGFQAAKNTLHFEPEASRDLLNKVMGKELTPEAERIVKEYKASLPKEII